MCIRRHWFNWSVMLVMTATLFASLPSDRIFLSAEGGPTRLSQSNPNASLVIPKEDVDAGKVSYRAIIPRGCRTNKQRKNETQITLVGGIGGCRMNMMWNEEEMSFGKNSAVSGSNADYGSSKFVSVIVLDNGNVALNGGDELQSRCDVVSKPNNNTEQGGKVVDFSVENILNNYNCEDIEIEFDERYKLYIQPDPLVPETLEGKSDNTVLIVCLSLAGALLLLAGIGFGLWCLWKQKAKNSTPAAPTDVKVVPAEGTKPEDSPDMPKVTAISNTRVKTTQPNPTPEVKPSKLIPKKVAKLEHCPTEEPEKSLPKIVVSSKKKRMAQPKVVISSKKQEKSSKKRAADRVKETAEKFGPLPPMHKKYKKGKSAVFADLSKIEDYKTTVSTCKTKEPNTMERSAQLNKCVEEPTVEEHKPAPPSTKRVPRLQKDYDDYVCSLEANKSVDKPEPEKQLPPSAKRQPRLREGMDPYVSSLEN